MTSAGQPVAEQQRPPEPARPAAGLTAAWPWLLIAVAAVAVWWPVQRCGFVWDDEYYVVKNTALREWRMLPAYFTDISTMAGADRAAEFAVFRPLRNISYLIDFSLVGLKPAWWHLHNLLLHTLNAGLLFLLARELFRRRTPALVAALLFLLHPVQTEAVAWIKCRDDLLSTALVLLACLAWCRWGGAAMAALAPRRLALICLLYLLACLAKEQAIVLPLLLLLLELAPRLNKAAPRTWCERNPAPPETSERRIDLRVCLLTCMFAMGAAALLFLAWRHVYIGHTAQSGYMAGSLLPTLYTMAEAGAGYLRLLLFPAHLLADYSGMQAITTWQSAAFLGYAALLLGVFVGVLLAARRLPGFAFGMLWVAVALLPVSNLVAMMQYMAERFLYLPMVGFAIAVPALLFAVETPRWARAALGVSAVLLLLCGVRTAARLPTWENNETLYTATVRDTPDSVFRPRRNLMLHWLNSGRYQDALPLARRLYEAGAKAVPPWSPRTRAEHARHLGFLLVQTGQPAEGEKLICEALATDATYAQPHLDLGVMAGRRGDDAAALAAFERAVQREPRNPDAHYNRGIALRQLGREKDAEAAFREAIRGGATEARTFNSLAALLWNQGRIAEARELFRQTLRLHPDDPEARQGLRETAAR